VEGGVDGGLEVKEVGEEVAVGAEESEVAPEGDEKHLCAI